VSLRIPMEHDVPG